MIQKIAVIPKWCLPAIRELVGSFIDECQPADGEESEGPERKITRQWSFGPSSLRAVLPQHMQVGAKAILEPCPCWDQDDARYAQNLF